MSIYTSTTLSRRKAQEIVAEAMSRDDDLMDMLNVILEKYTYRNCYQIVASTAPNEDNDEGVARWKERSPV